LKNQMAKLTENLAKLEETVARLSFIQREIAYLIGVKGERAVQSNDHGSYNQRKDNF